MGSYKVNIGTISENQTRLIEQHKINKDAFGNAYIQLEYNIDTIEKVSIGSNDLVGFLSFKGHSNQPSNREFTVFASDEYSDVVYVNKSFIGSTATVTYSGTVVSEFVELNYMKVTHGPGSIVVMNNLVTDPGMLKFMKRLNGQTFNSFNLYTELNKIKDSNGKSITVSGKMLNTCGQFPKSSNLLDFNQFTKKGKIWTPRIESTFEWDQYIGPAFTSGGTYNFNGGNGCYTGSSKESSVTITSTRIYNTRYSINSGTFSITNCLIEPKNVQTLMYMIIL